MMESPAHNALAWSQDVGGARRGCVVGWADETSVAMVHPFANWSRPNRPRRRRTRHPENTSSFRRETRTPREQQTPRAFLRDSRKGRLATVSTVGSLNSESAGPERPRNSRPSCHVRASPSSREAAPRWLFTAADRAGGEGDGERRLLWASRGASRRRRSADPSARRRATHERLLSHRDAEVGAPVKARTRQNAGSRRPSRPCAVKVDTTSFAQSLTAGCVSSRSAERTRHGRRSASQGAQAGRMMPVVARTAWRMR